jgi:hypothetical protein
MNGKFKATFANIKLQSFAKCLHFSFYLLLVDHTMVEWLFIRHNISEEDDDGGHVIFYELYHTFSISQ